MRNRIMLTFDVEEFDTPLAYRGDISLEEQLDISRNGLVSLSEMIDAEKIECTFFTTAYFALSFPDIIKDLSERHEIASHTFYHSEFKTGDLRYSKNAIEQVIDKEVVGLRMPRMKNIPARWIANAGYRYDSSINPTFLPGRYNHLSAKRSIFLDDSILRIPASVSPRLRIPLFWLGFQNYPYFLFRKLCIDCLKQDGYLVLYFHPWEFTDHYHDLPFYLRRYSGPVLLSRLQRLVKDLKQHGQFTTMLEVARSRIFALLS